MVNTGLGVEDGADYVAPSIDLGVADY